jgi:hypothetical protein
MCMNYAELCGRAHLEPNGMVRALSLGGPSNFDSLPCVGDERALSYSDHHALRCPLEIIGGVPGKPGRREFGGK